MQTYEYGKKPEKALDISIAGSSHDDYVSLNTDKQTGTWYAYLERSGTNFYTSKAGNTMFNLALEGHITDPHILEGPMFESEAWISLPNPANLKKSIMVDINSHLNAGGKVIENSTESIYDKDDLLQGIRDVNLQSDDGSSKFAHRVTITNDNDKKQVLYLKKDFRDADGNFRRGSVFDAQGKPVIFGPINERLQIILEQALDRLPFEGGKIDRSKFGPVQRRLLGNIGTDGG